MATSQTVSMISLPNGVSFDGDARLSIFIAPRLMTDQGSATLAEYPDFLDWPEQVSSMSFTVTIDGVNFFAAGPPVSDTPHSHLWRALFKPTTPVRSFQFTDRSNRRIFSYPVGELVDDLHDQYVRIGTNWPDDAPDEDTILEEELGLSLPPFSTLTGGLGRKELLDLAATFASNPDAMPWVRPAREFIRLLLFHRPRYKQDKDLEEPSLEFHDIISALGQFPMVLRALGLVIDFELHGADVLPNPGTVQVSPLWNPASVTNVILPITHWEPPFRAAPRSSDSDLRSGLLRLGNGRFRAFQVDVDGAAINLVNMWEALHRKRSDATDTSPPNTALPAMRSAGIAVARTDRASHLRQGLSDANVREHHAQFGIPIHLFAESLLKGYQPQVILAGGQTLSLCRRTEDHTFLDAKDHPQNIGGMQESWVSSAVTETDDPIPDMHLQETLFRWEGWSLVAPRPGAWVEPSKETGTEEVQCEPPGPPDAFRMKTKLGIEAGTLPRLRFGEQYQLVAPIADLAGNQNYDSDLKGDSDTTVSVTYWRYEPLPPPVVLMTSELSRESTPGESLERLVIHTNIDGFGQSSTETSERHLVAPMSSQFLAETHGKFDHLDPAETYSLITKREVEFPQSRTNAPGPIVPVADLDPDSSVLLPYLPDPLFEGVAITHAPGMDAGQVARVIDTFQLIPEEQSPVALIKVDCASGIWESPRSLRVRLAGGSETPQWDAADRVLTLFVPAGTEKSIRVSGWTPNGIDFLALYKEVVRQSGGNPPADFARSARQGRHWMLTPWRELRLVNASRQPIDNPQLDSIECRRDPLATWIALEGEVVIDQPSTGRIEFFADVEEWLDSGEYPETPGSRTVPLSTLDIAPPPLNHDGPREVTIDLAAPPDGAAPVRQELGDTRFRRGEIWAEATSRFVEYFPPETGDHTSFSVRMPIVIPASARPDAPRVRDILPTFRWKLTQSGQKRMSRRDGNALQVTLERPWFSSGGDEQLAVVLLPNEISSSPDLEPFVSWMGADPIWTSWSTSQIRHLIANPSEAVRSVRLAELASPLVDIAPVDVRFDAQNDCWVADVFLETESQQRQPYFPFARLALARYQPHALHDTAAGVDLRLSSVVVMPPVQVFPVREVTIVPEAGNLEMRSVTVHGSVPWIQADDDGTLIDQSTHFEISIERRLQHIADEVLGWEPVDDAVIIAGPAPSHPQTSATGQSLIWQGTVQKPQGGTTRLVVREYESFLSDGELAGSSGPTDTVRRLVYADAIELV